MVFFKGNTCEKTIKVKSTAVCMTNIAVYLTRVNLGNVPRRRGGQKYFDDGVMCH